jgi:hypothetical protein
MVSGAFEGTSLLRSLLEAAQDGLAQYSSQGDFRLPASRRLAFRELGLAIGLSAIGLIEKQLETLNQRIVELGEMRGCLAALASYAGLGTAIECFWIEPEHRKVRTWSEHRDINEVMLATSLVPEGYLLLPPVD